MRKLLGRLALWVIEPELQRRREAQLVLHIKTLSDHIAFQGRELRADQRRARAAADGVTGARY